MELDDLKARWQKETKENLHLNKQSMEQLQGILKDKTSNTLTGVKRKYERIISFLMIGIFLNILISPFLHFLLGDEGPVFRLTFSGLLSLITVMIMGLIVLFFYWRKYSKFNAEVINDDLRKVLRDNISKLKGSLKHEIWFITILFASIFILGRASSQFLGNGDFGDIFRKDILLAMLAGFLIMGFYIYKRISAYRKNIKELQEYLSKLDED